MSYPARAEGLVNMINGSIYSTKHTNSNGIRISSMLPCGITSIVCQIISANWPQDAIVKEEVCAKLSLFLLVPSLKIDLVSYPARAEGLVNSTKPSNKARVSSSDTRTFSFPTNFISHWTWHHIIVHIILNLRLTCSYYVVLHSTQSTTKRIFLSLTKTSISSIRIRT